MKILVILNGSSLKRWGGELPAALHVAAAERGERPKIIVTRSLEHMNETVGQGIEAGAEIIFAGGGDGTLHHVVNHPMISRTTVAMLPVGTINAFLRASGCNVAEPVDAFRQLLRGRTVEGHVGRLNGRRFACFASWGFDARVVHTNPAILKRYLRAASYGVTGINELWNAGANTCRGRMKWKPGPAETICATSVIVSKISNYAGMKSFRSTIEDPTFGTLYTDGDNAVTMAAIWATIALRGTFKNAGHLLPFVSHADDIEKLAWRSRVPAHVQLDGEAVMIDAATHIRVDTDPVRQRYLVP